MKQTLTISLLTEAQNGSFGKNEVQSMTRSEAVERMAKILCQWDTETKDCTECCHEKNKNACRCLWTNEGYIARAEAALDALLGEEK